MAEQGCPTAPMPEHRAGLERLRCRVSEDTTTSAGAETPVTKRRSTKKKGKTSVNRPGIVTEVRKCEKENQEKGKMVPKKQELTDILSDVLLENEPTRKVGRVKVVKIKELTLLTPKVAVQNTADDQVGTAASKEKVKKPKAVVASKSGQRKKKRTNLCDPTSPDVAFKRRKIDVNPEKADEQTTELITEPKMKRKYNVKPVPSVPSDITTDTPSMTKKSIKRKSSPEKTSFLKDSKGAVRRMKQTCKPKLVPSLHPQTISGNKSLLKPRPSKKWKNPNPKNVIKVKIKRSVAPALKVTSDVQIYSIEESNLKEAESALPLVKPKEKLKKKQSTVTRKRGPKKKNAAVAKCKQNKTLPKSKIMAALTQPTIVLCAAKPTPQLRSKTSLNNINNKLNNNEIQIEPEIAINGKSGPFNKPMLVSGAPKLNNIGDISSPSCSSFKTVSALDNDGGSGYSINSWARDISSSSGEVVPIAGKVPTLRLSKLDCGNYRSQIQKSSTSASSTGNSTTISNAPLNQLKSKANLHLARSEYSDIVQNCNSVVNLSSCTSVDEDKETVLNKQQIAQFITAFFRLAEDGWISQLTALTVAKIGQLQEKGCSKNLTEPGRNELRNKYSNVDIHNETPGKASMSEERKGAQVENTARTQTQNRVGHTNQIDESNSLYAKIRVPNTKQTEMMPPPKCMQGNFSRVVKNEKSTNNIWLNEVLNNIPTESIKTQPASNMNTKQVQNSPRTTVPTNNFVRKSALLTPRPFESSDSESNSSDSNTSKSDSSRDYERSSCPRRNASACQNEDDEEDIVSLFAPETLFSCSIAPMKPSNQNTPTGAASKTVPFKFTSPAVTQVLVDDVKPQRIVFDKSRNEKTVVQKVVCEKQSADSTSVSNVKSVDIGNIICVSSNERDNNKNKHETVAMSNDKNVDPKLFSDNCHLRLMYSKRGTSSCLASICYDHLSQNCTNNLCKYQHITITSLLTRLRPIINNVQMFTKEYLHIRKKIRYFKWNYDEIAKVFIKECITQKWLSFLLELAIDAILMASDPKALLAMCIGGLNIMPFETNLQLLYFRMSSDRYLIDILLQEIADSQNFRHLDSALIKLVRHKSSSRHQVELQTAYKIVEQVLSMTPHSYLIHEVYCSVIHNTDPEIWSNVALLEKFKQCLLTDDASRRHDHHHYDDLVKNMERYTCGGYKVSPNLPLAVDGDGARAAEGTFPDKSMRLQKPGANAAAAREGVRYTSPDTTQYQELWNTTKKPDALMSMNPDMAPPACPRNPAAGPGCRPPRFGSLRPLMQISAFRPRPPLSAPRFRYTPPLWAGK